MAMPPTSAAAVGPWVTDASAIGRNDTDTYTPGESWNERRSAIAATAARAATTGHRWMPEWKKDPASTVAASRPRPTANRRILVRFRAATALLIVRT